MTESTLSVTSLDAPERKHHRSRTLNKSMSMRKHSNNQSINQSIHPKHARVSSTAAKQLRFLELLLQRFPILTSASPQSLDDLSINSLRKHYQKGDCVSNEHEIASHIYIVTSGEFALSKTSSTAFDARGEGLQLLISSVGIGEEVGTASLLNEVQSRLSLIESQEAANPHQHGHNHASIHFGKPNFGTYDLTMTCSKSGAVFAVPINQFCDVLLSCKHLLVKHVLTDVALHAALHSRRFKQAEAHKASLTIHDAHHVQTSINQSQLSGTKKQHRLRSSQNTQSIRIKETLLRLDDIDEVREQHSDDERDDEDDAKARTRERAKKALLSQIKSGRTVGQSAVTAAVVRNVDQSINRVAPDRKQWQAEMPGQLLTDEDVGDETRAMMEWLNDRDRALRARHETQQPMRFTLEQALELEQARQKWKGQANESYIDEEEKEDEINQFLSTTPQRTFNKRRSSTSSSNTSPRGHRHTSHMSATLDLINRIAHANKLSHIVHPSAQIPRSPSSHSLGQSNQSINEFSIEVKDWKDDDWQRPVLPARRPRFQSITGPEYERVVGETVLDSDLTTTTSIINQSINQSIDTSIDSPKFRSLISQRQSSPNKFAVLISTTTNEPFLPTLPDGSINHELIRTVENGDELLRVEEEDQSINQSPFPPQSFFATEKETMEQLNSHLKENQAAPVQSVRQSISQPKRVLGYSYMGLRGRNSSLQSGPDTLDSMKARKVRAAAEIVHRNERALMAVGIKPQSINQSINQSTTDPLQLAAMLNDSSASDKLILNNAAIEAEIRAKHNLQSAAIERAINQSINQSVQSAAQYLKSLFEANKLSDVAEIAEILTREKLGFEACKAYDHAVNTGGLLPSTIQKLLSDSVSMVANDLKQVEMMRDEWRRQAEETRQKLRQRASVVMEKRIEADQSIDQSIDQSVDQSVDQTINQSDSDEYSDSESDSSDDEYEERTIAPSRFGALHSMIAESAEQAQHVRETQEDDQSINQSMNLPIRSMSNSVTRRTFQIGQNDSDRQATVSIGVEQASDRPVDDSVNQSIKQSVNQSTSESDDSLTAPPMVDDRCYTAPTRFISTPDISKLVLPTIEDDDQSIDQSIYQSNATSVTVTTRSNTLSTHRSDHEINIMVIQQPDDSNQSISQSINPSFSDVDPSINQSINQSTSESEDESDDEYLLAEDEWDELLPIQPEALELPLPDEVNDQSINQSPSHSTNQSIIPEPVVARDFLLGEDVSLIRAQVQANIEHETAKLRKILAREAAERAEIERRENEQIRKAEMKKLKAEAEERERQLAIEAELAAAASARRRKDAEIAKELNQSISPSENKDEPEVPVDILSLFHPTTPPHARQRMKLSPKLKSIDESHSPRAKKGKSTNQSVNKPTKSKVRGVPAQVMLAKPSTAPHGGRSTIKPVRPDPKLAQLPALDQPTDAELEAQSVFSSMLRYQLLKRALEQAAAEVERRRNQQIEIARAKLIAEAKAAKREAAPFVIPLPAPSVNQSTSDLLSPSTKIGQIEADAAAARAAIARLQAENEQRRASEVSLRMIENARLEEERRLKAEARERRKVEKQRIRDSRRERRASSAAHDEDESDDPTLEAQQSIRFSISPAESPKTSSGGHSARSHNRVSPSSALSSKAGSQRNSPRSAEPSPFDAIDDPNSHVEPAVETDLPTETEIVAKSHKKHKKKRKAAAEHSKAHSVVGSASSSDNDEGAADGDLHDMANGNRAKIRVESELAERDWDSLPATRHSSNQSIYHLDAHLDAIAEFDCTVLLEDAIQRETSAVYDERFGGYMPKNFFTYQFASDAPSIKLLDPRTHTFVPPPFEYDDHPLRAKQRLIEARGASEQEAVAAAEKEIKSMIEARQSMKAYATRTKETQPINKRKHALAYLEREALKQVTALPIQRGSMSSLPGSFASLSIPSEFDAPSIPLINQSINQSTEAKFDDADEQARMREQQHEMHSRLVNDATEWQRQEAQRQTVTEESKESLVFSSSGFSPKASSSSPLVSRLSPMTSPINQSLSQSAPARLKLGSSTYSARQAAITAVTNEVDRTIDEQIKREIFDPAAPLVNSNGSLFPPIRAPVQSKTKPQQLRGNGSFSTFSDLPQSNANVQSFGQMPFAPKSRNTVKPPPRR